MRTKKRGRRTALVLLIVVSASVAIGLAFFRETFLEQWHIFRLWSADSVEDRDISYVYLADRQVERAFPALLDIVIATHEEIETGKPLHHDGVIVSWREIRLRSFGALAIPYLLKSLEGDDCRSAIAIRLLGAIGRPALSTRSRIAECLSSENLWVQVAAVRAIDQLGFVKEAYAPMTRIVQDDLETPDGISVAVQAARSLLRAGYTLQQIYEPKGVVPEPQETRQPILRSTVVDGNDLGMPLVEGEVFGEVKEFVESPGGFGQ